MSSPTPDQVAERARAKDPGLPPETARLLAADALEHPGEDAPALARRLLADHPDAGATAATVVARAACELAAELASESVEELGRPPAP